jgi:SAM-dependent methyltransferase
MHTTSTRLASKEVGIESKMGAMSKRLTRLLRDPAYREHACRVIKLFIEHPKAIWYKSAASVLNRSGRAVRRLERFRVQCAVCGWKGGRFETIATFGYLRRNARCPQCGALERHRAIVAELEQRLLVRAGSRCLDVGGIPPFEKWFRARGERYVSLSLGDPASVCMDVEAIGFADASFHLILDSHVLEYVSDYRKALGELWRVLQPGGTMLLTEAYLYGQPETCEFGKAVPAATFMVRRFGDDLVHFLEEAGFQVSRWDYTGRNNATGDYFFLCRKP